MEMTFYRYYIHPSQDADSGELLAKSFVAEGFKHYTEIKSWSKGNHSEKFFYFKKIPKIEILCLRLDFDANFTSQILQYLNDCEKKAEIDTTFLLGKIDVWAGYKMPLEETVNFAAKHYDLLSFKPVEIKIEKSTAARLNWLWPNEKAIYAASIDPQDENAQYFLEFELPCIEASLLKLDNITKYYKEKLPLITKKKNEMDQRLARIINSSFSSIKNQQELIKELENQLENLSSLYSIIASDYSIVLEGIDKISQALKYSQNLLYNKQKNSIFGKQLYEKIFNYYIYKLEDMKNIEKNLRISRENYQAAIDVLRSRLDILISHENIETQQQIKEIMEVNISLQKQGLVFQFAAGLVEFIVLAYYSHSLWKALSPAAYHMVEGWIQFIIVCLFSGCTVYLTHLIAEYIQGEKHFLKRIITLTILLFILLAVTFVFGIAVEQGAIH
ncbi:hypothetical protein [Thermosyntropha sp.]|uniref:hypothetical protein n=1 Tax=Thermosyntropha sp. TaxID=2740820 RepID=UPI0025E0BC98|nr:hypothetical protein [Thermosyntropha sp.]MBO8159248.1 hypothetical protein [Thermosyntropha sp.]